MATKYGFSELECKILLAQIERRARYRKEFLKLRTDPCKHSQQAGYVFDKSIQQFISMKGTTLEYFPCNFRTISFGIICVVMPMSCLGYALWTVRTEKERKIRCGILKYRDRGHKFA